MKRSALRALLQSDQILVVPGAVVAITARLIQHAGFDAVYATGAGIANAQFGWPDIGLVILNEMVEPARQRLVGTPEYEGLERKYASK